MSTQAQAFAEVENTEEEFVGTLIEAVVIVTATGPDDLSFSTSSTAISIKGKDIILKPLSTAEQPVLYNLIFRASEGVARFLIPAAEFSKDDKNAALAINPDVFGREFRLSFVNNLSPTDQQVPYEFDIIWTPPVTDLALVPQRRVTTDPTILLDPPNS